MSDADDEARCTVRRVLEQLQTSPAHRIAVRYARASPYALLLHEHLAAAHISFNGPGVLAVRERGIARGFLAVVGSHYERSAVFGALAHAPMRDGEGMRIPVSRWERVARRAAVVSGDDWERLLSRMIADLEREVVGERARDEPNEGRIARAEGDAAAASAVRSFVLTRKERLTDGTKQKDWRGLSEWVLALFHDLYGEAGELTRLPPSEQYAAVTVEHALRSLAELDALRSTASLAAVRDILDAELESAKPRVGRFGEGVFVGPISAASGIDFDAVFILGLAEDLYPGRMRADALLPDAVRAAANGELPTGRDRIDELHRQLLCAFASAPLVVASFPRGDLRRSTPRLPSRWLLPTLRALSGNPRLAATEWETASAPLLSGSPSFWSELRRTASPSTDHEWRVRTVSAVDDG